MMAKPEVFTISL